MLRSFENANATQKFDGELTILTVYVKLTRLFTDFQLTLYIPPSMILLDPDPDEVELYLRKRNK